MSFGPHTVTIVKTGWDGTTRDRHNNPVRTVTGTFDLVGAFVQQRGSDEELQADRESNVTLWNVIAPPPTAPDTVTAVDLVRVNAASIGVTPDAGETFATFGIDGLPDHAHHITGVVHHLELIIRRVEL